MSKTLLYSEVLRCFEKKPIVTIAAGVTCAYLGDERNLREFLIADETAKRLRAAGHTVFSLLISDSMDPLTYRQLRVAVNKDETLLQRYESWCGKPIGMLPDPWECHSSYAAHFEHALSDRLHPLSCSPTLVSTAQLYKGGKYASFVRTTLERYDEILEFLSERFEGYQPEKLFWPLCPHCEYIDETELEIVKAGIAGFYCRRCGLSVTIPFDQLTGKLNWKLDCAARWALFQVDAEPFTKAYLEPKTGTFTVAQALSRTFFDGPCVHPLRYGLVKMDRELSNRLLPALPPDLLRSLMVESPMSDLNLTPQLVLTTAARTKVHAGKTYSDVIKQLLPIWLLNPTALNPREHELLTYGMVFAREFLHGDVSLQLPGRHNFEDLPSGLLYSLHALTSTARCLRQKPNASWDDFHSGVRESMNAMGTTKGEAIHRLRQILGQEQGVPIPRLLFTLPLDYLSLLEYVLELSLAASLQTQHPMVQLAA